jgi:glycosyltransferase involved in cell wall biosynthesis
MKISIAMATYNGAQYLEAQLQSFVDQTRPPDELIITDDCSTDGTADIVYEFAKTAPFEVVFCRNEKNLGYCGNFNAALMQTTGDLVFLSDQDDVWFPEKIAYIAEVAERNPEMLVVMNDAALTDGGLNEVGLTKIGQIRSAGLELERFVMGCCCAVRLGLLAFCLPIPEGLRAHDSWLVKIADGLDAKLVDGRVLQYYRRHESNESQFIANRTTRVSRAGAFLHSAKKILDSDTPRIEQRDLEQLKIFAEGIEQINRLAPEHYRSSLTDLFKKSRVQTDWIEQRMAMRRRFVVSRVVVVTRFLMTGGYSARGGLKAFLRDLAG